MFLSKEQVKEKLDRIDQIKRIIGAMAMLTTNSKRLVANFANSRLRSRDIGDAESRLTYLAILEGLALLLVAFWQVWYVRRLLLKRRIF